MGRREGILSTSVVIIHPSKDTYKINRNVNNPRCHSSQSQCQNALNVVSLCTLLRKDLQGVISGTWAASSAACATRCWTAPTTMPGTTSSSARHAMGGSLVPRVMDLEGGLEHLIWMWGNSLEILSL